MAAEAARVLDYSGGAYYGSAAPAQAPYAWPAPEPEAAPAPLVQPRPLERVRPAAAQSEPVVSLFAVFGTILAGVLMVFVVLAQISFNDIASETVRFNTQYSMLTEQERKLEIEFESVINMKEVERYARDTLGMSKPDSEQVAIIRNAPVDTVEIIESDGEEGIASGLGSFISSLLKYLR